MSISHLLEDKEKPWSKIRVHNIQIDGGHSDFAMKFNGTLPESTSLSHVLGVDSSTGHLTRRAVSSITNPQAFAIVAPSGGDYTNLEDAIDANERLIFVKSGTYTSTGDITILGDTQIIGQSPESVIIDMNGYDFGTTAENTINTGTISITRNTSTVTGSGTDFTQYGSFATVIRLNRDFYKIASIDSATQVTLVQTYRGPTISGGDCYLTDLSTVEIRNLHITNTVQCVLQNTINSVIERCYFTAPALGSSYNVKLLSSAYLRFECNYVSGTNGSSSQDTLQIFDCSGISCCYNTVINSGGDAIWLNFDSNCKISGNNISQAYNGIRIDTSNRVIISDNSISYMDVDGIRLDGDDYGDSIVINSNRINECVRYGMFLDSSGTTELSVLCTDNDIDECGDGVFVNNAYIRAVINSNIMNEVGTGIILPAATTECHAVANNVRNYSTASVTNSGTSNIVANNSP